MTRHDIENVAAVVVTFNPGERFHQLMTALRPQVGAVLVVDNGSGAEALARIQAATTETSEGAEVTLILNPENQGLAAAQNQGIAAALDAGFDWVLLMDHDSVPDKEMVATLLAWARDDPNSESIGFLAPLHVDEATQKAPSVNVGGPDGKLKRWVLTSGDVEPNASFAMASGCLIPSARLRDVGLMAEDFFIDYIDFDFSFRIRRAGYRIVVVGAARLSHRLGESQETRFLFWKLPFHVHTAERRYTIYRNRTWVKQEYGSEFPEFERFEVLSKIKDILKLLLEPERVAKFRAIRAGIRAGKRGRGGVRD